MCNESQVETVSKLLFYLASVIWVIFHMKAVWVKQIQQNLLQITAWVCVFLLFIMQTWLIMLSLQFCFLN